MGETVSMVEKEELGALEESSQREKAIPEHAAEGIFTSDEKGLIETFNPMAERMFGYEADEVIGKNLEILMSKGDAGKHGGYIKNYLKSGKGKILGVRERQLQGRRKDGALVPLELNVAEVLFGGERKFIGTMRDITERKKAEEEARRAAASQTMLQAVAQAANEAHPFNVAMQAGLAAVCGYTGWPVGHVYIPSDDDPDMLVPSDVWFVAEPEPEPEPERFEPFRAITATTTFARGKGLPGRVFESGKPFWISELVEDEEFPRAKLSSEIGLKSGFAFPVLVRGEVAAVMEFYSDEPQILDEDLLKNMSLVGDQIGPVIERNWAFDQLADALKKTKLTNRAKTDFLANMSHELRTPLNSIIGFSEVVLKEVFGPIGNARYADYMADIHSSGRHLLALINDILDVSKVEVDSMELVEENLDVEEVIWGVVRVTKGRTKESGLDLSVSVERLFPRIKADSIRIKQILLYLLSNAVKFTPEGGTVTVGAEMETDGRLAIFVTDTGIGISEGELKKVLQPFVQASSGLDRRHEGTGLGLYLVKMLIEKHGGAMAIESSL